MLLDKMLERGGKTRLDLSKNSTVGRISRRRGVPMTPDLERVKAIPRRRWQDDPDIDGLCREMTAWLKTPNGTWTLRPIQTVALLEAHDFGGAFVPVRVGGGKTLILFLLGTVLGLERVCILIPAKLRQKTENDLREMRKHWRIPSQIMILSYQLLSKERGLDELFAFRPQLLAADEAHKLKNRSAGCTRRLSSYLKQYPETPYVDLTASAAKRSLLEYTHRIHWAIGEDLAPLPKHYPEALEWALALDEKVPTDKRIGVGKLLELCDDEEIKMSKLDPRSAARLAFGRRLMETPGVIGTDEVHDASQSILITGHTIEPSDEVLDAFTTLRADWKTPDGHPFSEAPTLWRHARELICGFYYRWNPRPPVEWLEARSAWAAYVRGILRDYRRWHTEMEVAKACVNGDLHSFEYAEWRTLRPTFKPKTEAVWICDAALNACAKWLEREKGICWVEHIEFGKKLARMTNMPYFGAGAVDATGKVKGTPEHYKGPFIASIEACKEGLNLQYHHHKNYVASAPPGGDVWEQTLGRTHREGQEADEVTADVNLSCREQWDAFQQARADAVYAEQTLGQPQKLSVADINVLTEAQVFDLEMRRHPLWLRKK